LRLPIYHYEIMKFTKKRTLTGKKIKTTHNKIVLDGFQNLGSLKDRTPPYDDIGRVEATVHGCSVAQFLEVYLRPFCLHMYTMVVYYCVFLEI
jgi:hypothetical protein